MGAGREFLEQVIEISPIVVYTQPGPESGFDYISNNVEDLFGYTPEDAAENWLSYVHPDDRDKAVGAHEEAADTGEGHAEVRFRHADGDWRVIECSIRRLPDSDGIAGFTHDVTEEREAQRRLVQGQQLSVLGRIAAGVAHDFNNMLAVISFNVAALRQRRPDAAPEIAEISTAVAHASRLVDGLVSFAGGRSVEPTAVGLSEVIRRLSSIFERLVPADVELEVDLADDLPPVMADRAEIERLVINLVVNSCDAMADGGRLRIVTRRAGTQGPESGLHAALIVEDTGHGIAPDLLPNIFEPFVTSREHGSGLGLAVVHSVVSRLDGDIRIDTSVGAGTTVTVELPAADGSEQPTAEQPRDSAEPGARVLVVDDVPQVLAAVAAVVQSVGYDVLTATSGQEALALIDQADEDVDLLLTDISMPGMQGPELARQLRERRPQLRVVYMSGFAAATSRRGDNAPLVQKPFSAEELSEVLRRTLRE